jgi:hypothetical protein
MEAVLNLSEKPLVFVTCPKHVLVSCLDKTIRFFFVSSVSCMIVVTKLKKKKKKGICYNVFAKKVSAISCIFICFDNSLCSDKIYIYMVKFQI